MGYTRLVQTGNVIEVFRYEREPALLGRPRKLRDGFKARREGRVLRRRSDSVVRAQQSFWRIVRGNLSKGAPALLTLTMLDIVGLGDAYKCYTAFGQRIRRRFGESIAWIAVPEFQKRGAVHFHVLMWGLPDEYVATEIYTRRVQNWWGYGYVS